MRAVVSFLLLVLLSVAALPAHAQERVLVHFVVISAGENVTAADFAGLKKVFLEQAGGYTELPGTVGSALVNGQAEPESVNTSFLVAGDRDISTDIKAYAAATSSLEEPFILVWEAQRK